MKSRNIYRIEAARQFAAKPKRTVRKYLNADTLIELMRKNFQKIPDHRAGNSNISIDDTLRSALAKFQLKDPSPLAFDKRRRKEPETIPDKHLFLTPEKNYSLILKPRLRLAAAC